MITVTPFIGLEESELVYSFTRASGPGGQNVNKVATACELRFDARRSSSLPADVAVRLMRLGGSKTTKEGVIVIFSDKHRSQEANKREALERLLDLIRQAAVRPKKRIATKPSFAAKAKRLESKSKRGSIKKARSGRDFSD
jgi:ribosome-associated protein